MSQKLPVQVSGLDVKSGSTIVQIIKLPTRDDWNKNIAHLHKKIIKKFKTNKKYELSINGNNIRSNDAEALSKIMSGLNLDNIPQFKIINVNKDETSDGEGDGRQIIVHCDNKTYTVTITEELSDFDDGVYNNLIAKIQSHFKVNGRLYDNVGGTTNYIDDWDDLSECLEDIEMGESYDLYFESKAQQNSNNDEDEKKQYIPQPPKYQGPKKEVSLLFVGETGVGKTTLLASFKDFINQVPYEKIKCTKKTESTGLSQTMDTQQYSLSNDEWAVNIIDTPGIGDTSGVKKDEQHMDNIIDFVGGYGEFNAVCILIKRGTTRLTTRMKYIVNELRSNMPKDVQSNFIVIMTRADVPYPDKDTKAVIKKLHLPTGNIVPINNAAYEEIDVSDFSQDDNMNFRIVQKRMKRDYEENHQNLQILLEAAVKMEAYQGSKMAELKLKRNELKEGVGRLRGTIVSTYQTEKEIREQLAALKQATTKEQKNRAYEESRTHMESEPYKLDGKITTNCNACNKACHVDCKLNFTKDLTKCSAMSGGRCKRCGCSISSHCHLGWGHREKKVTVKSINQEKKLAHMSAQQQIKEFEHRKDVLKAKLDGLRQKRDQCVTGIQHRYKELEKIAIIGHNESYELYMKECIAAVEKDGEMTREEKEEQIGGFKKAIQAFTLLKDAVSTGLKNAASYLLF